MFKNLLNKIRKPKIFNFFGIAKTLEEKETRKKNPNASKKARFFKYFGINQPDEQTEYYEKRLEERKKNYKLRKLK